MTKHPRSLTDRDLDGLAGGALTVDPNDYEDYATNRGLISADFEGNVTVRMLRQTGPGIGVGPDGSGR